MNRSTSMTSLRSTPVRTRQRGNALLYTLLALVLGGIGLAVGVSQYQDAERATSVQATVGEVSSIIGNAKQNFGQYQYANLTTAASIAGQVIPASMATSATAASNRFGGGVTLVVNTDVAAPGTARLAYAGVPASMCVNIINGTQALARQIQVGATDVKPLDGAVDLAALTTQCNAGAVTIAWIIGRT